MLVVEPSGAFAGVISDSDLLRRLLPSYLDDNEALARVLEVTGLDAVLPVVVPV